MHRILLVVVAAVVVVKVASSDAKHAPPMRVASRVTSPPPTAPPPPPVLDVVVAETRVEEPAAEPEVEEEEADDAGDGVDLDVALEQARFATSSNGALQGVVRDSRSGEAVPGVTVVATSPALQGALVAITDENGAFHLTEMPSASYLVTLYYIDTSVEYSGIAVVPGKTTPFFHAISTEDHAHGITIDVEYTKTIPIPSRTFESVLGASHDVVDEQPVDPCAVIE